jgi:hypothetical protein
MLLIWNWINLKIYPPACTYPSIDVDAVTCYIKSWNEDFDYIIKRYMVLTCIFMRCCDIMSDEYVRTLFGLADLSKMRINRDASSSIYSMLCLLSSRFTSGEVILRAISNIEHDEDMINKIRNDIKKSGYIYISA